MPVITSYRLRTSTPAAAVALDPEHLVAVVGNQREQVEPHILEQVPDAVVAVQETQDGTGHAVRVAVEALQDRVGTTDGTVVVHCDASRDSIGRWLTPDRLSIFDSWRA